jgi:hypothetical protein
VRRYAQSEVEGALHATRRGMFTAHDQIVLAAEVQAFRNAETVWWARAWVRWAAVGLAVVLGLALVEMVRR